MKEKLIIGLLWFFGFVFLIGGLTLFGESFMGAVFMTLSGVALLPIAHNKIRQLTNKDISLKWFLVAWLVLGIASGFSLRASDERALRNGTASPELVKQEAEHNEYREKERIKREQEEARKLADKERREQASYGSPSASNKVVSEFNACRSSAISAKSQLAGTQYKTKVIMDSTDGYIVRICTNDGSVLITCDASNGEMITSKSSICSLD